MTSPLACPGAGQPVRFEHANPLCSHCGTPVDCRREPVSALAIALGATPGPLLAFPHVSARLCEGTGQHARGADGRCPHCARGDVESVDSRLVAHAPR